MIAQRCGLILAWTIWGWANVYTVAAITYGGWSNNEKIEKYKNQLIARLEAEGIPYTNRFYALGYNAPYEVFNRKNEVIVELESGVLDL